MAQRLFRSDDTDPWMYGFGFATNGVYSSSGSATDAPIDSGCSGSAGSKSLTATNASFAPGQIVVIHQTRGTNAGLYELNRIEAYTAGTITLAHQMINDYADSGADQAQVLVAKQYSSFTQNTGHTLSAKAWNGTVGGIIAFLCNGDVSGTGSLALTGLGFRNNGVGTADSDGNQGEGTAGAGTISANANGNGGGAGTDYTNLSGGGGGNAAAGQRGYANGGGQTGGFGGIEVGNAGLTVMTFGGEGGGSGRSGHGGNGAGILLMIAKSIDVSAMTITLGGEVGTRAGANSNGGGGGAGGSALLKAQTATLGTAKITAPAGAGSNFGIQGGNGAVGRIHLDYLTSYTGTTTPSIDVRQDTSLVNRFTSPIMFF